MVSRILLFIFFILQVSKMIKGYPNLRQKLQLQNNVNNTEDTKNRSQNYPKELISFFSKENFKNWNLRDNKSKEDTQKVIFPEELISSIFNINKNESNKFKPVIPPECHGETICEHAPDYPEDIFGEGWDDSFLRQFATEGEPSSIDHRMSNENIEGQALCRSTKQAVIPRIGMTTEGDYRYIIQSPNLKQWYESEICIDDDHPCNELEFLLPNYSSVCKQNYITRSFVSSSYDGNQEVKSFRTKSNCCCRLLERP